MGAKNERIYYKQKSGAHKPLPTKFSSPMLKQSVQKKVVSGNQNPISSFKKIAQSGPRNINHIMKKYNHVSTKKVKTSKSRPKEKVVKANHKRNKPNTNALKSISKNLDNAKATNSKKQAKIRPTPPLRQKEANPQPRTISQKVYQLNSSSKGPNEKSNKFLVKNVNSSQNIQYGKKRNFSPIASQNQFVKTNQLFPQKKQNVINVMQNNMTPAPQPKPVVVNSPLQREETLKDDSLGGGSRVNTKTGSVLGFGNNSRIPDNLSVISR